ncbi:MAG: radical SAM protein [Bacteroidales bacterium]|nr:radical SAM protein [Bacteroidales bacterium]
MKRILLVSANQLSVPYPVYPVGISYLKTYLKSKLTNYDISLFDFINRNYDDLNKIINDLKPEYIGISLRNIDDANIFKKESYIDHYKTIIQFIRKTSNCKIIIGGAGFSIFPEILYEHLEPDFGIQGEGEDSFYKLILALDNNSGYSQIESLVYKVNNKIIVNKKEKFIEKLDLNLEENLLDFYWRQSGMLNIQTKRGCPYNCIYCTYPLIEGRNVRTLDAGKIVETLSDLYYNKKIDYFFFTDSVFNISNNFNYELAERIISKNLDIKWGAYFNFCNLDEKLLGLLKKAGLKHIEFGTESLSDTVLKSYNKPFKVSDIFEISGICNKLEIDFAHFLILGGYGETEDTINETLSNSMKIDKTVFFPFIGMRIYPNTKLHEIAIKENKIEKNCNLLEPVYYISDKINLSSLKENANKTGKRWVFPDEDLTDVMNKMRLKNKKGPLWEYLIK